MENEPISENESQQLRETASATVFLTATWLMIIAVVSIAVQIVVIPQAVMLLMYGDTSLDEMNHPASPETRGISQLILGGLQLIAGNLILIGAIHMKRLRSYRFAKLAAALALIFFATLNTAFAAS